MTYGVETMGNIHRFANNGSNHFGYFFFWNKMIRVSLMTYYLSDFLYEGVHKCGYPKMESRNILLKWMIYDDLGVPHIDEKPPYIYIYMYIYIYIMESSLFELWQTFFC